MALSGAPLRRRILIPVAGLLIAAGVASAAVTFYLAKSEADELLDYQLEQLTRVVATEGFAAAQLPPNAPDADTEDDFVVFVWDEHGQLAHRSADAPAIERPARGFTSVMGNGARWRVFSEKVGARQVAVAQRLDLRTELASAGALQALIPVVALVPLLGVLIGWIVLRSLRPLRALSAEVERRAGTELHPLPEWELPEEVRPLLRAINGLLARLDEALARQKRFVADAAHELRTPLGALQLQAEMLESATEEEERRVRARNLRSGIARLSGLVSQLLTMARLDAAPVSPPIEVDLLEVVKEVIAEFYPLAEARAINLGFTENESVTVRGQPAALWALFANLVQNALRYTPEGGQVDISVRQLDRNAVVSVTDSGPGIPEEHLERVFDRFFRVNGGGTAGHGLGLAIARAAAEQHHARIELENRRDMPGLCATVTFPL
jgi:two-component system, OmpR family, sensor kinase